MEEKINIAEILKDKKNGLRLYSPIFGDCTFCYVREDTNDICVKKHNGVKELFDSKGLYYNTGEVMLFPSKEMRDWSKFFNKGDVLVCYEGKKPYYTIFNCFNSNTYKDFNGKFAYDSYEHKWYQNEGNLSTNTFNKLSIADSEIYITKIEERFGGKLNIETLEIENSEFNDGDVLFVKCNDSAFIEIFEYYKKNGGLCDHASLDITNQILDISGKYIIRKDEITELRLATEEEKKQFFSALAKKGKAWDSEKKDIVDLKPKVDLKPFDKVLCRNSKDDTWEADFFARLTRKEIDYTQSGKYLCVGDLWMYCIPYNEETAHLLGTTDEWKVGEI